MTRRAIGITCALLMSCSVAAADPIVVTGGSMSVVGVGANDLFMLQGDGLSLTGVGHENIVGPGVCNPCIGGSITFNATLDSFVHLAPSPGSVGGRSFPDVILDGTMSFFGPSFPVGPLATNPTLTAPFTFSAMLRGFPSSAMDGAPLFENVFIGGGTATANYIITPGPGATLVRFRDVTYQFEPNVPVSPTPEPASVLLVVTGLAAAASRRRRTGASVL